MTNTPHRGAQDTAPRNFEHDPDIRILRRAEGPDGFPCTAQPRGPFLKVAVADVETTGLDPIHDQVIDIAVALVRVDSLGRIVEVIDAVQSLRDPGRPIPEAITDITGITDADVAGVEFDERPFVNLLRSADLCVAHNAAFDVPFIEGLTEDACSLPWACSMSEFDWTRAGFDGAKLGHLLMQMGKFADAHRASSDVTALLHVLSHEPDGEETVMRHVIRSATRITARVEATGAPYHRRGDLKQAGYRWDATRSVWWIETHPDLAVLEENWLKEQILPYGRSPRVLFLSARDRYR